MWGISPQRKDDSLSERLSMCLWHGIFSLCISLYMLPWGQPDENAQVIHSRLQHRRSMPVHVFLLPRLLYSSLQETQHSDFYCKLRSWTSRRTLTVKIIDWGILNKINNTSIIWSKQMEDLPNLLSLFHTSMRERAHRKCLEMGGPFKKIIHKKNTEGNNNVIIIIMIFWECWSLWIMQPSSLFY